MKKAFTLAQVLITLGIIGIVAALTIPTLINNYQKKANVIRLKKSYSLMQQALKLSQIENGEINNWDTTLNGSTFFAKYIAPYVKYTNEYTSVELAAIAPRTLLNGNSYDGTTYTSNSSSHFLLSDGSLITVNLNNKTENGLWVGIDVNGLTPPNQIGKDTFLFYFSSQYGLQALGDKGTPTYWLMSTYSIDTATGSSYYACKKNKSGYWCSALIMLSGWTIPDDYPW